MSSKNFCFQENGKTVTYVGFLLFSWKVSIKNGAKYFPDFLNANSRPQITSEYGMAVKIPYHDIY